MLVKGLKVDIVAWIPIIFCVLGCVSTKDDLPAIARHSFRRRSGIPSVSSGGSNGLVELERDEVVKERNKWSEFILDTHREPKERLDGGLSSSGGIRTAGVAGGNAIGNSGKSTHGSESRGITKSTLLEALSPRHCDFEESKNCNNKERAAEERSIDDVAESEPIFAESKERQRRGAKVNRRLTDERIFFPESSTQTTLNTSKKNQPNNSSTAVVGGNQSGSTGEEEGGDGLRLGFGPLKSSDMADCRFSLLLTLGFLIATYGTAKHGVFGDVEQTTKGKKDLLSIILTPNVASTGAKVTETSNRTSDLLDEIISDIFDNEHQPENSSKGNSLKWASTGSISSDTGNKRSELPDVTSNGKRANPSEIAPNSSSNGNQHFHSHPTGDFNAGRTTVEPKTPDAVNGKVNKDRARGDSNSSHSNYVGGKAKANSSDGVFGESDVHFPGEGSSNVPEVLEGVIGVNDDANYEVSRRNSSVVGEMSGQKGGKYSKETTDTPGKIDVEPYFIIDAPIRESDDGHGCKNGQRWSFGHCRDILD